jgi:acyl-coenzyme A thioesterase PaaI-like protein
MTRAIELATRLLESAPGSRIFGISVQSAEEGSATVALDVKPAIENAAGSLHVTGLMALVDAAALAAMSSLAGQADEFEAITTLATDAQMSFIGAARGRLQAGCELDPDDQVDLAALLAGTADRARLTSDVRIVDEDGTLVCRGFMVWKLRRGRTPSDSGVAALAR